MRAVPALVAGLLVSGALAPVLLAVPAQAAPAPARGSYYPVRPVRVLDGRVSGAVPAGSTVRVQVAGASTIPASGVLAVQVNISVLDPARAGSLTAIADGTHWAGASVSFSAGKIDQNAETVPVSAGGLIDLRNNAPAPVILVADVLGYYQSSATVVDGAYVPLAPTRVLDTRRTGSLGPGAQGRVTVAGVGAIPATASAVIANVTVLGPARAGSLSLWQVSSSTVTPSVSFAAGQTEQDELTGPLSSGTLSITNNSTAAVQLVIDVVGYFSPAEGATTVGDFNCMTSYSRSYDSRIAGVGPVRPGQTVSLGVTEGLFAFYGPGYLDPGIAAVAMNISVVSPAVSGSLSVWPSGSTWDHSATVTFTAHQNRQRMVLVQAGGDPDYMDDVQLRNDTSQPLTVVVDLIGFMFPPPGATPGLA